MLIKKLNSFLNIPKQIKTCISCLEIILSDDDQPRCYECKQDNILQLESKLCLCGKKIPCVEKDGITRTKNTCKNCTTKHVPKMNKNCWKRKLCFLCCDYTVSAIAKLFYKCDPRPKVPYFFISRPKFVFAHFLEKI